MNTRIPDRALEGLPIEALNSECFCISLDADALRGALESELGTPGLYDLVRERCPHLFAARPVFVSSTHMARMAEVVRAVESVVALPAYREEVLASAPAIARRDPGGPLGVAAAAGAFEQHIVAMFRNEWRLFSEGQSNGEDRQRPLRSIAIVDQAPVAQYLYPEFLLFKRLFERHGIGVVIADPGAFATRGGALFHGDTAIDLVYNRLTDFALEDAGNAVLREACLHDLAALTPHPRAHALYADKRNLILLSDPSRLRMLGVPESTQAVLLAGIPRTELVVPGEAERLWRDRRLSRRQAHTAGVAGNSRRRVCRAGPGGAGRTRGLGCGACQEAQVRPARVRV
jgi:hypothetical protein